MPTPRHLSAATLCLLLAVCTATSNAQTEPAPFGNPLCLELKPLREPSGICFHPGRGSLFAVGDRGDLCEFTPEGELLRLCHIRNADFEGITCNPATGLLYLAIESTDSLLEVDPETLQPLREFALPRIFEDRLLLKAGGSGIEAVTFAPDPSHPQGGTFFVANQSHNKKPDDLSAILEVELPLSSGDTLRILNYFLPEETDLAGLYYNADSHRLYAISDTLNLLVAYTRNGQRVHRGPLPGENQEGLTFDAAGRLYIAQDSGGFLKLEMDPLIQNH
jgi:hypothetical protein